jgi:hypothetical protein
MLAACDARSTPATCVLAGTRPLADLDPWLDRLTAPPAHGLRESALSPRGPSRTLAIGLSVERAGTLDPWAVRDALHADIAVAER